MKKLIDYDFEMDMDELTDLIIVMIIISNLLKFLI